jgi:hypothetical protein
LRRRRSVALAVAATVSVAACDAAVYLPEELAAQKRYDAVAVGTSEADLRARLGAPECVVNRKDGEPRSIELRCPETSAPHVAEETSFASWRRIRISPTWIAMMALPEPGTRLLIFVDGTVYGYFVVDPNGVVTRVKAVIS